MIALVSSILNWLYPKLEIRPDDSNQTSHPVLNSVFIESIIGKPDITGTSLGTHFIKHLSRHLASLTNNIHHRITLTVFPVRITHLHEQISVGISSDNENALNKTIFSKFCF